jgi:hypothetical protein
MGFGIERLKLPDDFEVEWSPDNLGVRRLDAAFVAAVNTEIRPTNLPMPNCCEWNLPR